MTAHYMYLHDKPFQKIKSGAKTFEFRLNDGKRRQVDVNDQITVTHADDPTQTLCVTILDRFDAPTIPELLEKLTPHLARTDSAEILHNELCKIEDFYTTHYSVTDIQKHGLVAFHIKLDDPFPSPSHPPSLMLRRDEPLSLSPPSPTRGEGVIARLPAVRGKYTANAPLGAQGWFKCGGMADVLFRPADRDDLIHFLKNTPSRIPVSVFGVLSNTIIRDGGIDGVVIKLGREFARVEIPCHPRQAPQGREPGPSANHVDKDPGSPPAYAGGVRDDNSSILLTLGAAALDTNVAQFAADHGLTGLEFLGGIPGTIGGAIKMNAGAIGAGAGDTFGQTSLRDVMVTATAVDRAGNVHVVIPGAHRATRDLHPQEPTKIPDHPPSPPPFYGGDRGGVRDDTLVMSYRHTDAPDDWIFVECTVRAMPDPGGAPAVLARMTALKERREAAQPTREKTGGSTFANPTPDELVAAGIAPGTRVWQLIDAVNGRGLKIGGAYMSEKHCNFMINDGTATAADLENLGEEIRRRVQEKFNLTLRWEIKRLGSRQQKYVS